MLFAQISSHGQKNLINFIQLTNHAYYFTKIGIDFQQKRRSQMSCIIRNQYKALLNLITNPRKLQKIQMESQTQIFRTVKIQNLQYKPFQVNGLYDLKFYWSSNGRKEVLTYEETCPASMQARFKNGFLDAFLTAYNTHGDVKITPDDVWLVILLYFSKYVNDNAEQLRYAFVTHEGKKKLEVTTWNQLSEGQWDEFFTLMIAQIKKNTTAGVTQKLQCNFSTTQRIQTIFSTAVVMNTFKKYFDYGRCIPLCGIKNVHFGGTLQDWKKVYEKLLQLSQYDVNGQLKRYIKNVSHILLKFIDTYKGKVDVDFWNKIINVQRGRIGSGSTTYFSGWLIHFFGYEEKTQQVEIESIDVEIHIDNKITGIKKTVNLVGGFAAVSKEGDIFRPHLSMAILDQKKNEKPK